MLGPCLVRAKSQNGLVGDEVRKPCGDDPRDEMPKDKGEQVGPQLMPKHQELVPQHSRRKLIPVNRGRSADRNQEQTHAHAASYNR